MHSYSQHECMVNHVCRGGGPADIQSLTQFHPLCSAFHGFLNANEVGTAHLQYFVLSCSHNKAKGISFF